MPEFFLIHKLYLYYKPVNVLEWPQLVRLAMVTTITGYLGAKVGFWPFPNGNP